MKINDDSSTVKKSTVEMVIQIGGLLIGILALGVTIFFSVRSEHSKEITVTYLSKRPLVTLEPGRTTAGVEVSLGGTRLIAPWLLSGRLENSGNQPIEARDIEESPQFQFARAKVISAEVVGKSQPGISAQAAIINNTVTISHKLLNPSDWVSFDMLFEGEPELPPAVSLRISGISNPKQNIVSANVQHSYISLLPLPKPVIYFLLTIVSGVGAGMILGGIALVFNFVTTAIKPKVARTDTDSVATLDDWLPTQLFPKSFPARLIYAAISDVIKTSDLDYSDRIERMIKAYVPQEILQNLNMNPMEATNLVIAELKEYIKEQLSKRGPFWREDEIGGSPIKTRSKIMDMDMEKASIKELAIYAKKVNDEFRDELFGESSSKYQLLVIGAVLLVLGMSFGIILGGTWLNLLSL